MRATPGSLSHVGVAVGVVAAPIFVGACEGTSVGHQAVGVSDGVAVGVLL
jgi:hypothetical protein